MTGRGGAVYHALMWLRPQFVFHSLADATPTLLALPQLKTVLLDVDNTLVHYHGNVLIPEAEAAVKDLQRRLHVVLISNNQTARVSAIAQALGVASVPNAMKPFSYGIRKALRETGASPQEAAMVGDQIFTDILGANRAGLVSVLTDPATAMDFPLTKIMRAMERLAMGAMGLKRCEFPGCGMALPAPAETTPGSAP